MSLLTLLRLSLLLSVFSFTQAAQPQLKLGRTTLLGQTISPTVEFFGRIPYAEPPLGSLRLRPPLLKTQLNVTTFDASNWGLPCIQPRLFDGEFPTSEDCLTINVHRPVGVKQSAGLPVFFWTYGGSYIVGASPAYNGSHIVERSIERGTPIIFVNFNYRIGPLGFPQGQEADDKKILNLGLHDQLAALEWVHANIEAFGGDKKKVTAVGESAGSILTSIQYLNPGRFEKLARGAIMQSGVANSIFTFKASRNEAAWKRFVGNVPSCASNVTSGNTLSCLRNAPTAEISSAALQSVVGLDEIASNLEWTPAIDGNFIPDIPSRLLGRGKLARVPMRNMTDQEIKDFIVGATSSREGSQIALEGIVDRVVSLYPEDPEQGSPYGTGNETFGLPPNYKRVASILGDAVFDGPRRLFLQAAAKEGTKAFAYQFTQPQPQPVLGVAHGADLEFVFGRLAADRDQGSQDISRDMMDYWISFVVSLDPNDGKGWKRARWPRYTSSNQILLKLEGGKTGVINDDYRKEQIEYLNKNSVVLNHR